MLAWWIYSIPSNHPPPWLKTSVWYYSTKLIRGSWAFFLLLLLLRFCTCFSAAGNVSWEGMSHWTWVGIPSHVNPIWIMSENSRLICLSEFSQKPTLEFLISMGPGIPQGINLGPWRKIHINPWKISYLELFVDGEKGFGGAVYQLMWASPVDREDSRWVHGFGGVNGVIGCCSGAQYISSPVPISNCNPTPSRAILPFCTYLICLVK